MSREVRRVPLGWQHPTEYNPYWVQQSLPFLGKPRPASRLHAPTQQFVGLYRQSISAAHREWETGRDQWAAGTHSHLAFLMRYESAEGYLNRDGTRDAPRRHTVYAADGETVIREFHPERVEELIAVYPYSEYASEPTTSDHMPDFDAPEDELGWCLYETVSEGTPVTPVFATAEELIDHLATVGQDWDQEPLRRSAAEAIVSQGGTLGSMIRRDGVLYNSTTDADLIMGGAS